MTAEEKIKVIVKALDSKRAENIRVLKVTDLTILGDYFVIANGTSNTHTRTLADEVEFQLSQNGIEPHHREGANGADWYILDYLDVIVHVFYQETRDFCRMEHLWADAEEIDIPEMLVKEGEN